MACNGVSRRFNQRRDFDRLYRGKYNVGIYHKTFYDTVVKAFVGIKYLNDILIFLVEKKTQSKM
jgi:hypothetical protein